MLRDMLCLMRKWEVDMRWVIEYYYKMLEKNRYKGGGIIMRRKNMMRE